jgi:hypothetical protein
VNPPEGGFFVAGVDRSESSAGGDELRNLLASLPANHMGYALAGKPVERSNRATAPQIRSEQQKRSVFNV